MKLLGIFAVGLGRAGLFKGRRKAVSGSTTKISLFNTSNSKQIPNASFDLKRCCYNAAQQNITRLVIPDEEQVVCQIKNQSITMA